MDSDINISLNASDSNLGTGFERTRSPLEDKWLSLITTSRSAWCRLLLMARMNYEHPSYRN